MRAKGYKMLRRPISIYQSMVRKNHSRIFNRNDEQGKGTFFDNLVAFLIRISKAGIQKLFNFLTASHLPFTMRHLKLRLNDKKNKSTKSMKKVFLESETFDHFSSPLA